MPSNSLKQTFIAKVNLVQLIFIGCSVIWQLCDSLDGLFGSPINLSTLSIAALLLLAMIIARPHPWLADYRSVQLLTAELVLTFGASCCGSLVPLTMLFILTPIKASILFEWRAIYCFLFAAVILRGFAGELNSYMVHRDLLERSDIANFIRTVPVLRQTPLAFIFGSLLSVFLFKALISEKSSRERVSKLSEEVENLVLKLERERIARDIHDSVGHTLTALKIQLDVAEHLLETKKNDGAERSIKTAQLLSKLCLLDVRKALKTIKEPERKFVDAISDLIEINQTADSPKVKLECEVDVPDGSAKHHLFCIVQESLTNIFRHASAGKASIRLYRNNDCLVLQVIDDGIGFDPQFETIGSGIQGMKYRAESLGGKFSIKKQAGSGTEILVEVPDVTI
ncbi:MAG: sensor histidine kinase [Leptolyngbya sp.]|nr:sensor histidine kinase [Candidatus Melainabacteria bacterium]